MTGTLSGYLREEFPAVASEVRVLTVLAFDAVGEFQRSLDASANPSDLSDEDVVARLQDPRAFAAFARRVIDSRVSRELKIAVAERVFDLIPIPASEFAAFRVGERTPPGLLRFARFLLENEAFTALQFLHLVYAAFLDLSVIREADRKTRTWLLMAIAARSELPESQRLLAAYQFLAAMPSRDAAAALHGILGARYVSPSLRSGLAAIASASDGGRAWFAAVAAEEGLLADASETTSGAIAKEVVVPALPEDVQGRARKWLESRGSVLRKVL